MNTRCINFNFCHIFTLCLQINISQDIFLVYPLHDEMKVRKFLVSSSGSFVCALIMNQSARTCSFIVIDSRVYLGGFSSRCKYLHSISVTDFALINSVRQTNCHELSRLTRFSVLETTWNVFGDVLQ